MTNLTLTTSTKNQIIESITKRSNFFTRYTSRKERLLHLPFKTFYYYAISVLAHIKPFKVKYKTLWKDTLTFYMPEGNAIYYYGFFEANLTNLFLRLLKEGDVFVDVGAHIGYYTNLCSHLVGESGQVHSFEPTPRTFKSLAENTKQFRHTFTNNTGVLDTETKINFVDYGPKYSAFNGFQSREDDKLSFLEKEKINISIPTKVLDTYFEERHIVPTFVKIDAEGADYLVLNGMSKTLQLARPIISLEVAGGTEWNTNHNSCLKILLDNKYVGYKISTEGLLTKHETYEDYEYDNLLFIPEEKTEVIMNELIQ